MDRKKRFFNRLLLVCGGSAVMMFFGYVWFTHRPARHFYLPEGYSGWVTVRFEKPGATELPIADGAQQLHIPESGIMETSSKLHTGWSKDEFFWQISSDVRPIPKKTDCGDQNCRTIHDLSEESMKYDRLLASLPEKIDTVLLDGSKISKDGERVDVRTGRKVILHFWVSSRPEPFFYQHDSLPEERKYW
jgi:hypothetical protein